MSRGDKYTAVLGLLKKKVITTPVNPVKAKTLNVAWFLPIQALRIEIFEDPCEVL